MENLKDLVRNDLNKIKKEEFEENKKLNSKLKKVILYTRKQHVVCDGIKKELDNNGIKYEEKDIEENKQEYASSIASTGMANLPVIYVNDNYVVYGRDYQNIKQLVQILRTYAHSEFVNPSIEIKISEQLKTLNYKISKNIQGLNRQLQPVIKILSSLAEEDKKNNA